MKCMLAVYFWTIRCSVKIWMLAVHFSCIRRIKWSKPQIAHNQGYSIILGKGPFTNVKIFRGPVTPIKSCKCDMPWIVLTKNITWEYNSRLLHIRGITSGAIPQAPNHCWFAEMSKNVTSTSFNMYICFWKGSGLNIWGRQICFIPWASCDLVMPLCIYMSTNLANWYTYERSIG